MWRRIKLPLYVTIRVPYTRCRFYLWPFLLIICCVYFLLEHYRTQLMLYDHRHFHFPEIPVPYVSVANRKSVPVANNAWIVTSSMLWSEKFIHELVHGGWKVVIVPSGPHNYSHRLKNCVILDAEARQWLKYKLKDLITTDDDDVVLKNLGYLYAIEHGAEYIYELDGGYVPIDNGHPLFQQSDHMAALILADFSKTFFDPMDHFGQPESSMNAYHEYVTCKIPTPTIQHGMFMPNGSTEPQVDAHAPAVVLPNGIYATYNSFNTFYKLRSFWSLLLISSNNTEVHRSFWAQRLMALTGQNLAIFPPTAKISDLSFKAESKLQRDDDFSNLANLLQSWNCTQRLFTYCIKQLGDFMVKEKIWLPKAADFIDAWLYDLQAMSHEQPTVSLHHPNLPCMSEAHTVYFNPNIPSVQKPSSRKKLIDFCRDSVILDHPIDKRPTFTFDTILLIVVFNLAHYNVLLMVDSILRDHYPNVLYCSPRISDLKHDNLFYSDSPRVSIVNATDTYGYYGYECVLRAMEMGYQVDGYMVVGDDVLINYWNFKSFDLTKVWAPSSQDHGYKFNRLSGKAKLFWWHVPVMGKVKVNQAFQEFEDILVGRGPYSNMLQLRAVIRKFWDNRILAGLGDDVIITYPIDTYFVPAIFSDVYYHVLQTFRRNDVFLEFAVTTTIESLAEEEMIALSGFYDWSANRTTASMRHFSDRMHFLHPVKFGLFRKSRQMKIDYCKKRHFHLYGNGLLSAKSMLP